MKLFRLFVVVLSICFGSIAFGSTLQIYSKSKTGVEHPFDVAVIESDVISHLEIHIDEQENRSRLKIHGKKSKKYCGVEGSKSNILILAGLINSDNRNSIVCKLPYIQSSEIKNFDGFTALEYDVISYQDGN